jgi:hypothetical protein
LRGYTATILPAMKDTPVRPDLLLERGGEKAYVEVELAAKDRAQKWQNLAALQPLVGVALCAPRVQVCQNLVGECRRASLRGRATDLETLSRQHAAAKKEARSLAGTNLWLGT